LSGFVVLVLTKFTEATTAVRYRK